MCALCAYVHTYIRTEVNKYLDCSIQQCEGPAPCHIGGGACSDAPALSGHVAQHISNGSIHTAHKAEDRVVTSVNVGKDERWERGGGEGRRGREEGKGGEERGRGHVSDTLHHPPSCEHWPTLHHGTYFI